jgi:hypothetical protein
MFEIKFEINGQRVDPNRFGDALEQAILQQISEQVSTTLRSVQCSEHGQYAKVTVKGQSLEKLSFEVSGCCQALVDQCIAKLK